MNLLFTGEFYSMGERYTDATKMVFLTVLYCTLYPAGFFFASCIFVTYYWVDKFSLLRSWSQGPLIGTRISVMSMFFFKICCLTYAIMAAYMVSQSPYDHACKTIDEDISEYMALTGPLNITLPLEKLKRRFMTINDFSADQGYKFCNQFLIPRGRLPGVQSEDGRWDWMNPTQETLTKIFGWTAVVVAAAVLFSALKFFYNYFIHPLFCKHFEVRNCEVTPFHDLFSFFPLPL